MSRPTTFFLLSSAARGRHSLKCCTPTNILRTKLYTLAPLLHSPSPPPSSATSTPIASSSRLVHSHSHSHSHAHGSEEADVLLTALKNTSSKGSRVTLIGLFSNVGLVVMKGSAGYLLGSSALLADAAHSGSDLVSDVVTLAALQWARRPASVSHPYGYGKYETLGSVVVSLLLVATAVGLGLHSYHLLLTTLAQIPQIDPAILASLDVLPHGHSHAPGVSHEHGTAGTIELVDPRAIYFAAASVVIKEYLYRMTLKVAKEEHSNVLLANAYHHRSDAAGSLVAVAAIGGAYIGFPVTDPLGGLLVSGMILKNGFDVGFQAMRELVDQMTDPTLAPKVHALISTLRDPSLPPLAPYEQTDSSSLTSSTAASPSPSTDSHSHTHPSPDSHSHSHSSDSDSHAHSDPHSSVNPDTPPARHPNLPILAIPSIRIFTSGPSLLVDVELVLPASLTLREANIIEEVVEQALIKELGGPGRVREVVVRLKGNSEANGCWI